MPSFSDVVNGAGADASSINQVVQALKGTAGQGIPLSITAVNDPLNYAVAVKNNDAAASKALIVYKADGTVLFQIDKNGVIASPDGIAGAAQLATLAGAQTFTQKILTTPTLTNPLISGTQQVTAGELAYAGTRLYVGDGTAARPIELGGWTTWAPSFTQGAVVSLTPNSCRWMLTGKMAALAMTATASSAGTSTNVIIIGGIPAAIAPLTANVATVVGTFLYVPGTGASRTGVVIQNTATTFLLQCDNSAGYLGSVPGVTLANGDILSLSCRWEIA